MRKITEPFRFLLLYLVALALLIGQGANAHIHLSEAHHHDGSHHHHAAEIHTDHLAEADLFAGHADAIELDSDYRISTPEKQKKPLIALTYDLPVLSGIDTSTRIIHLALADGWLDYPELATRHSRAPPINL